VRHRGRNEAWNYRSAEAIAKIEMDHRIRNHVNIDTLVPNNKCMTDGGIIPATRGCLAVKPKDKQVTNEVARQQLWDIQPYVQVIDV
jgi:hypothetical protein